MLIHWDLLDILFVLTIRTEVGQCGIAESFYQKQKRIAKNKHVVILGPYFFGGGGD